MLATPDDEMAGTIPFASLNDDVSVVMEQGSAQHRAFIVDVFFLNGACC
jgi:hypothetical protein